MNINSENTTENTDEFNQQYIYKTLLINLKNEFKDSIKDEKLEKRVECIENVSNKVNIKFYDKYQKKLNWVIDAVKSACEQNDLIISNETSINEQISQLLNDITHKQRSIKRLATSVNEYTEQLETIDTEEERAKQLLQLFNDETQLLTYLKPNLEKNVNIVKQHL